MSVKIWFFFKILCKICSLLLFVFVFCDCLFFLKLICIRFFRKFLNECEYFKIKFCMIVLKVLKIKLNDILDV